MVTWVWFATFIRSGNAAVLTRDRLRQITIVWIVCLAAISLQPYRPPEGPGSILHRAGHMVAFGAAGLMLLVLSDSDKQKWAAALKVICLAVAIETAQHLLYKGPFEWWDVRDDIIGLLIAVLLIRWTRVRSLLVSS